MTSNEPKTIMMINPIYEKLFKIVKVFARIKNVAVEFTHRIDLLFNWFKETIINGILGYRN